MYCAITKEFLNCYRFYKKTDMEYFLSGKLVSHAKPILFLYQIARIFLFVS